MSYIKGLAHIGIYVKNMDKSIDFYKRLGFTLDREVTTTIRLAFLSAGTCLIELIDRPELEREAGIIDHIAIEVTDLDAMIAHANANGIEIDPATIRESLLGGVRNLFFHGINGERLELFENVK